MDFDWLWSVNMCSSIVSNWCWGYMGNLCTFPSILLWMTYKIQKTKFFKSIVYKCVGLYVVCLFCSLIQLFVAVPIQYLQYYNVLKSGRIWFAFSSFSELFDYFSSLHFHTNFNINLSIFIKITLGFLLQFHWIYKKLRENQHLNNIVSSDHWARYISPFI